MANAEYKITYRTAGSRSVKAASHNVDGDWIVFYDADDNLVLRDRSDDIESVALADVAERATARSGKVWA